MKQNNKENKKELLTLGIETSTVNLSIALLKGKTIKGLEETMSNKHDSYIINMITTLLERSQINKSEIDLISIDCGPGAFTSIRVGVSTARALAQFGKYSIVPVSALSTIRENIREVLHIDTTIYILSIIDAKQKKLYASLYKQENSKEKSIKNNLCLGTTELIDILKSIIGTNPLYILGPSIREYIDEFKNKLKLNKIYTLPDYYNYPHGHNVALLGQKLFLEKGTMNYSDIIPYYKEYYT